MYVAILNEAKKKIAEGDDDPKSGGLASYSVLIVVYQNMVPLIKFLSEPGIRVKMQKAENYYLADQQKEMPKVDEELLFHIDEKNNSVDLTDKGIAHDHQSQVKILNFLYCLILVFSLAEIEKSRCYPRRKIASERSMLK